MDSVIKILLLLYLQKCFYKVVVMLKGLSLHGLYFCFIYALVRPRPLHGDVQLLFCFYLNFYCCCWHLLVSIGNARSSTSDCFFHLFLERVQETSFDGDQRRSLSLAYLKPHTKKNSSKVANFPHSR